MFVFSNTDVIVSVYLTIFCGILLLALRKLLSNERKKNECIWIGREVGRKRKEWKEGKLTIIRIYYVGKQSIFNKRKRSP